MTNLDRHNYAVLHSELTNLLTHDCDDDAEYYKRLTWALEIISSSLSRYTDLVQIGVRQRSLEEDEPDIPDDVDESFYNPYTGCDEYDYENDIDLDGWSDY